MNKLITTLLLVASFTSWGQLDYNSPYSIFGLGDMRGSGTVYNQSMGGVGVTNGNAILLNLANPAMLTRNRLVTFDLGLGSSMRRIKSGEARETSLGVNFDGLFLGFPVSKKITTAIGVSPWSMKSYDFTKTDQLDATSSVTNKYKGSGGVSKFVWSTGYKAYSSKVSKTYLSLGLEAGYLFGPTVEEGTSLVTSNGIANAHTGGFFNRQSYSGFSVKAGTVFRKELKVARNIVAYKKWNEKMQDSVLLFSDNNQFYSKKIVDAIAKEMVVGKYLVLLGHRTDIVVSPLFKGKKSASYFKSSVAKVKPKYMGVYIKSSADAVDKATIMKEYDLLLEKYNAGDFAKVTDENYDRALARKYEKRGSGIFFNVGGTYGLQTKATTKLFKSINQYDVNNRLITSDTLVNGEKTTVTLPSSFQLGFSIDKPAPVGKRKDGLSKTSVWSLALDIETTNWSEYKNTNDSYSYDNSYSVRLGGEICPDITQKRSKKRSSKIFYRAGLSYANSPYSVGGKTVQTIGMNIGVGLPMFGVNQLPRYINLNLGIGQRGLTSSALVQETYYNLGLSFAFNNKFTRRKVGL